jgi:hypothetical protein
MEGFLFGFCKYYFTDVVSTLVVSTDVFVESTATDVESVVVTSVLVDSVLVASLSQDANNATIPIDKITFLIFFFFVY